MQRIVSLCYCKQEPMRAKFYRVWSVAILSVSVLIFCVSIILVVGDFNTPSLGVIANSEKTSAKVGEATSVSFHFTGQSENSVDLVNLELIYDKSALDIKDVMPGPYFSQAEVAENGGIIRITPVEANFKRNSELSFLRVRFEILKEGETEVALGENSKFIVDGKTAIYEAKGVTLTINNK